MGSCATLLAPWCLSAKLAGVTESLTVETAERVWNEDVHLVADVAGEERVGESSGFKGENEEAGILPLSVSERRQTPDMGDPLRLQTVQNVSLRHEPHFWSENGAFAAVPRGMERDSYCLFTEVGAFQKKLGLCTCLGPDDERAVCRSFDFKIFCATDVSDVLRRPENVDASEGHTVIAGFNHQVGAVGLEVWSVVCRVSGGQVRARVSVPGVVSGQARVIAGGGGLGRAKVRAGRSGRGRAGVESRGVGVHGRIR